MQVEITQEILGILMLHCEKLYSGSKRLEMKYKNELYVYNIVFQFILAEEAFNSLFQGAWNSFGFFAYLVISGRNIFYQKSLLNLS